MSESPYKMSISLNVLEHLGTNLYSDVPPVLSEVVANSWDADAIHVDINIEPEKITITDDGHGMDLQDINEKYLKVGYKRRNHSGDRTALNRPVMGRKGIGKLSLFSIANTVTVETVRGKDKNGFVMSVKAIEEQISETDGGTYQPGSLSDNEITLDRNGTRIVLTGLKKRVYQTPTALKKRIARRFSIIGTEDFMVSINGVLVDITDRDYFNKLQYLWHYGKGSEKYVNLCDPNKLEYQELGDGRIEVKDEDNAKVHTYQVTGWIGTVKESGDTTESEDANNPEDNLNKIVIMVRGKLAQEDILEDFTEGGLYTKYIIGEIHADFLDMYKQDDIATSNRQEIIKDDPRYIALQSWVKEELRRIKNQWTKLRNKEAEKEARQAPGIDRWFESIGPDKRKQARAMFGKIAQLPMNIEDDRKDLYQYCALAFENLKHKDRLSELESLSPENLGALANIFASQAELEAAYYYKTVDQRLSVIDGLDKMVKDNTIEKMIQNYLADNLWLLDPTWERATDIVHVEQTVAAAFKEINNELKSKEDELSKEERRGRIDIRYKKMSGHHVIIELKRPELKTNDHILMGQVSKYRTALQKELNKHGGRDESIEVICVVGENLREWTTPIEYQKSVNSLADKDIRVILYGELIKNARLIYQDFLKKRADAGSICQLIRDIEIEIQQDTDE